MVFSCKENETDIHQQDGITDLIISKYVYFSVKIYPELIIYLCVLLNLNLYSNSNIHIMDNISKHLIKQW
mgnify:CR=1 FL=1